jgi:plastocyanin
MNTKTLLILLGIVVLVIVGITVASNDRDEVSNEPATEETGSNTPAPADTSGTTITYTKDGFSPANLTVPVGTTVTWVNQTSDRMWVGADEHPTHREYDGSSTPEHCVNNAPASSAVFDQCSAGSTYSFTFTKTGSWDYHNHARSSHGGTITVQ